MELRVGVNVLVLVLVNILKPYCKCDIFDCEILYPDHLKSIRILINIRWTFHSILTQMYICHQIQFQLQKPQ